MGTIDNNLEVSVSILSDPYGMTTHQTMSENTTIKNIRVVKSRETG